ncbi:pre-mRNA-splicing factor syf2 [Momordica charantia]|uniref:Pre-mRNA-splicing factor SYF2 n=1 Tax=Momordica charantia TaxID=3673 RepID=A0A6J1CY64_MOMCH|nr:pre-mRNA-splicing factor syf2 [Momordica charantia]XP_022146278.1 pre-mRNA-splicing factor syf2 [Momordica charantia]XP_022146280.1 pre-mRNA-splicing factor syf2 [Momordica charantia]
MSEEGRVHPDCRNASNPYHECSEYCFKIIAEVKARNQQNEQVSISSEAVQTGRSGGSSVQARWSSGSSGQAGRSSASNFAPPDEYEDLHDEKPDIEGHSDGDVDKSSEENENVEGDFTKLTGRKKKLFELRLKMNEARKANQTAIAAEKKKMEPPSESRGISKQKWLEDRKKKIGKLLDANGLDMTKAYMLDTQEAAESKYKKWEKDPAPYGWDVFNQKTLYNAYKKRTKNVNVDLEEYNKMKDSDPEFYREASSLQYGKAPKISEDKIDNMVKELKERDEKRKSFSRRRKFHEDKDIDSINDRNEHFNKKIERAFGRYTLEIKNNLERGTALPD